MLKLNNVQPRKYGIANTTAIPDFRIFRILDACYELLYFVMLYLYRDFIEFVMI